MKQNLFDQISEVYYAYKPRYSNEFIEYLYDYVGFSKRSWIANIGSGSGLLSQKLLDRGSKVVGVEPDRCMRNLAEQELSKYVNFISINGLAEKTKVGYQSVDFVIASQDIGKCNEELFKKECNRILKENGKVVVILKDVKNSCSMINKSLERLKAQLVYSKYLREGKIFNLNSFFENGLYEEKVFEDDISFNLDEFLGMNLYSIYPLTQRNEYYKELVYNLTDIFNKYCKNNKISFPQSTRCYIGRS